MSDIESVPVPRGFAVDDVVYVAARGGELLAIGLHSGQVLARSRFPAEPFAADRTGVVAWTLDLEDPGAHDFAIEVRSLRRDRDRFEVLWRSVAPLPSWASGLPPGPDSLQVSGDLEGDAVVVRIEAHARHLGGAPPPPTERSAATNDLRKILRLDRATGSRLDEREGAASHPTTESLSLIPQRRLAPYKLTESWETRPWRTATGVAQLMRGEDGSGVALARLDDNAPGNPRETVLSTGSRTQAAVTLDGRWVLVGKAGSDWQIFSAEDGRLHGSVALEPGTGAVAVIEDMAINLIVQDSGGRRERILRCRELPSGRELWSKALETESIGAPPPLPP